MENKSLCYGVTGQMIEANHDDAHELITAILIVFGTLAASGEIPNNPEIFIPFDGLKIVDGQTLP